MMQMARGQQQNFGDVKRSDKEYAKYKMEKKKNEEEAEKERRRNAEPHIEPGTTMLDGSIKVLRKVGSGGFGQIYEVVNRHGQHMAMKTGLRESRNAPRMRLEQNLVYRMGEYEHFPSFYRSGNTDKINYIIMELLGPNLHDLRKNQPDQSFCVRTALRIGKQMLNALQTMHDNGFLHRDVKPSNMCVDGGPGTTIVLVDFGLSRRFLDKKGKLRPFRDYASFRGTSRYVSPRVHLHQEHTVWDDIYSLSFSIVELVEGKLPWRGVTESADLCKMKQKFSIQDHAPNCPRRLGSLFNYLKQCEPEERCQYNKVFKWFNMFRDNDDDYYFEWERHSDSSYTSLV